jgi:uncharacterized protein YfaP (DUF2135 family)
MKLKTSWLGLVGLFVLVASISAQSLESLPAKESAAGAQFTITVQTTGHGAVAPPISGKSFAAGSHHTLVANPAAGNEFAGWSGSFVSNSAVLTFTLTSNINLQAAFVTNPFVADQGNYNGLFYPGSGVNLNASGSFRAAVMKSGAFTANLFLEGASRSVSGKFSVSGLSTNSIKLSKTNIITLMLQLDMNGESATGSNSISGTLVSRTWTNSLTAFRSGLFSSSNHMTYNFAVSGTPSSTTMPVGAGVGSIQVTPGGSATLSGVLADGTTVSSSASISQDGFLPVFASLYSGKGAFFGWLKITNQTGGDISGVLEWIKPTSGQHATQYYPLGFSNLARVVGSVYHPSNAVPIIASNITVLTLSQGNLPSVISNGIVLKSGDKVTSTNHTLKVAITPATGLFQGSVSNTFPAKNFKTLNLHGVFLQKQNAAVGFFLGTNQSGLLNIGSDPFAGTPVVVLVGTNTSVTNFSTGRYGGTNTFNAGPLGDITVVIPAGAVTSNVTINLSQNSGLFVPQSGTAAGYIIDLELNGGSGNFLQPVSITIPYPTNGNDVPVPFYISTNGTLLPCQVLSIDTTNGTLTFQTFHASLYTWILAHLNQLFGSPTTPATAYLPWIDGFQVGNPGSIYNPGGECFGICAFEQWFFKYKGGGFYPKYMQDIPLGNAGTIKGQEVIRTRAFDSVAQLWSQYLPFVNTNYNLPPAYRMASMIAVLENTAIPTIVNPFGNGSHAILAYDHTVNGNVQSLLINDPNYPGTTQTLFYDPAHSNVLSYQSFPAVALIGEGSFQAEGFDDIYADAEAGFDGNGAAQVNVTSDTDGETITNRTITFSGNISSGQVLVSELDIVLNQGVPIKVAVSQGGYFSVELSLNEGTNTLGFVTKGINGNGQLVNVANTQLQPFKIIVSVPGAVILATLTWDTDGTDLDLYTIDPTGDFSAYYHHTTADGGNLDFDNTTGYGPEHWTLNTANTVRWGSNYVFRVHYYDDHVDPIPGPAIPTEWTVSVLLYEGTAHQQSSTFTGELAYHDAYDNDGPNDTGASWADVCTVVPIQADESHARATMSRGREGQIIITVPVPSLEERIQIKTGKQ